MRRTRKGIHVKLLCVGGSLLSVETPLARLFHRLPSRMLPVLCANSKNWHGEMRGQAAECKARSPVGYQRTLWELLMAPEHPSAAFLSKQNYIWQMPR